MKEYDLIMLEDDPYFFLQMRNYEAPSDTRRELSGQDYLDSLTPSYLSIDTQARVVHADSFSKVIAPGCRAGWITSNPLFIERLTRAAETSTQATGGFVQAFIAKLLVDDWGMENWIRWLKGIAYQYEQRRDFFCDVFAKANENGVVLDSDVAGWTRVSKRQPLCTFIPPVGGMFIWAKIAIDRHPRFSGHNTASLMDELWILLAESGILLGPGSVFASTPDYAAEACFFRISFSMETKENLKWAAETFADIVKKFFKK